jgi:hypothetical protein
MLWLKKTKRMTPLKLKLFLLLLPITVLISANDKKTYTTQKITSEPPRIDGLIDDEAWNTVEWSGDFVQVEPYENKAPSQQTKFKILYDDNNLYIAIKALDSAPDSIVQRMSRRDGFEGDWLEVNIDSYHDLLTGFSFNVSAAGVKGDEAITNDGNNWDSNWDPIWYVKTSIDKEGWVAEMQIPFSQIRFSKKNEYVWGLEISRRIFRRSERSCWQFISPTAAGWVHNFGELQGISNIEPLKQAEIVPYVLGKVETYEREKGNKFADGRDLNGSVGLDGKIGVTNNLTLDFTINPDFGQVEADPSEVNLTTFETYFPEKRTFFIEGKNILSHQVLGGGSPLSSDNLFYSRRIGKHPGYSPELADSEYIRTPNNTTILGAFKLTGKTQNGYSVGVLESFTQKEIAQIDSMGENRNVVAEPFTNYFLARVEKDFNNSNSRIGAMITSTNRILGEPYLENSMHKSANTGGINFNHNWKDKTYYFNFNVVFSQINGSKEDILQTQTSSPHYFQRPDANYVRVDSNRTSLQGWGGTLQAGKAGNGKLMYTSWLTWRSPGLNLNDIGYLNRNDEIMEVFWVGYYQNEPFSIFRNANVNFNQWYGLTFGLDKRYFGGNLNGHVQYKNYWCTGIGISRDGKNISTETMRGGPALVYDGYTDFWGHIGTDERQKVRVVLTYEYGYRDGNTAWKKNYSISVDYRVTNAFKISLYPTFSKSFDEIDYAANVDTIGYKRFIRGTLHRNDLSLTIRLNYNISPDFTIQLYAMPFISAGSFNEFKYIINPEANSYSERYKAIDGDENLLGEKTNDNPKRYFVDENRDGIKDYTFENPNYNRLDFNANLVLRWEFRPGSVIYFVWSQNRFHKDTYGHFSPENDTKDLFMETYPHDVLLMKFSYRFGN